jgi:hypothetical protein
MSGAVPLSWDNVGHKPTDYDNLTCSLFFLLLSEGKRDFSFLFPVPSRACEQRKRLDLLCLFW